MICDVCKALCSDNIMTYCRKKWMCLNCFQKWQKSPDDTRHLSVTFLQPQNCTIDIIQNVKKPDDTYEAQTVESVTLRYEHIGYDLDSPQMWHIAYRNQDACYYDNFKTEEPAVQFLRAFVNGMASL